MRTIGFLAGLVLLSSNALALPQYPPLVREDLGLPPGPGDTQCTLCHTGTTGTVGTATKPFARSLEQFGVTGNFDAAILKDALLQIEMCHIDSDGDGVDDVDEIRAGTDPDDGHGAPTSTCGDVFSGTYPMTGCGLSSRNSRAPWGLAGVLALCAVAWRRRRFGRRKLATPVYSS